MRERVLKNKNFAVNKQQKSIAASSSDDAHYLNLLHAAREKEGVGGSSDEIIAAYLEAATACPNHAEALHSAARYCRNKGLYERGYEFAAKGLATAHPNDGLPIEDWIYQYGLLDELAVCAYWTERYAECVSACDRLLSEGKMPTDMRDRVVKNKNVAIGKQREIIAGSSPDLGDYIRLLRAARETERQGASTDEIIAAYVDAAAACPTRAEALHDGARFCREKALYERGYEFATKGLAIAYPNDGKFVEDWIYQYGLLDELAVCSYWTERYDDCLRACERLLEEGKLPTDMRERVAQNARFAQEKLSPLPVEPTSERTIPAARNYRDASTPAGVYTEQDVNSEAFDQPVNQVRAKIIICSTPRTGSYLLCRAMIHGGIGIPHEYFNGINARIIGSRFGLETLNSHDLETDGPTKRAYIAALLDHRTINGIFAVKIQRGQFRQYFKSFKGLELFKGAHFIYIYREDLLAQAVSLHMSLLTGRWGIDNAVTTRPAGDPQFFNNELIAAHLEELATQDREWRLFFARNAIQPLFLSYEGTKHDLGGALRRVVTSLRLHLPPGDFDYVEPQVSAYRAPGEPSKLEVRDRFARWLQKQRFDNGDTGQTNAEPERISVEAFGYDEDSWVRPPNKSAPQVVSEEIFVDEVLEQNIVIDHLYEERDALKRRVQELETRGCNKEQGGSIENEVISSPDEVFIRLYNAAGRLGAAGQSFEEVIASYDRASDAAPGRAEALHGASRFCRLTNKFAEGYDYAQRGLAIPSPCAGLSPQQWIYDYGLLDELAVNAYWIERYQECFEACQRLLGEGKIPDDMYDRVKKNADFAAEKIRLQSIPSRVINEPLAKGTANWIPAAPAAGTELMVAGLRERLGEALEQINLQVNHPGHDKADKRPQVVWMHHDVNQRWVQWCKDEELVNSVDCFVFVSNWQREQYLNAFGLPPQRCFVLRHAIDLSAEPRRWEAGPIWRCAYTSTPFRGLAVLLDAWERLKPEAELHIWSSMKLYLVDDRPYEHLYRRAEAMHNVFYHGISPNAKLRAALRNMHFLVYPCTFRETACLAVIEAMAAGCRVIVPSLGALPETTGGYARIYPSSPDAEDHAFIFSENLRSEMVTPWGGQAQLSLRQQAHCAAVYDWPNRLRDWKQLIELTCERKVAERKSFVNSTCNEERRPVVVQSVKPTTEAAEVIIKCEGGTKLAADAWYTNLQESRRLRDLKDEGGFVRQALATFNQRPCSAEPLYDLARFYRERGMNAVSVLFSEFGLTLKNPDDEPVDNFIYQAGLLEEYSIGANYSHDLARKSRGFAACNWLALSRAVPASTRHLAMSNLDFYVPPANAMMPSFTERRIEFDCPEGYRPLNPSITVFGERLALSLRCYTITKEDAPFRTPNGAPAHTRNFLLRLNNDMKTESSVEILSPDDMPSPKSYLAMGFEDIRPFVWRGDLWCCAGIREMTADASYEFVVARLQQCTSGQFRLSDWRVLCPEGRKQHEKNWMPRVSGDTLQFIYSCDPTRVVDEQARTISMTSPVIAADHFRGGTQAIPFEDGWLALIHETRVRNERRRYWHRFVYFDVATRLKRVSHPFVFHKYQIEYGAGLAWHPDGKRLLISYGIADCEAWIATVDASEVQSLLSDYQFASVEAGLRDRGSQTPWGRAFG
jgi:LPS sulfotransferase NodH/glycosyltransferase involved in cell wall biosynthesis